MTKLALIIILLIIAVLVWVYFGVFSDQAQAPDNDQVNKSGANQEPGLEREARMAYAQEHISDLSPAEPVLGGSWYATRFWFAAGQDDLFYVEYEDGHIMRQILLSYNIDTKDESSYKIEAYFEPGEAEWQLVEGQDLLFGQPVELYEIRN